MMMMNHNNCILFIYYFVAFSNCFFCHQRMYPELAASGRYVSGGNKIYTTSVRSPPPYSQVSAGSIKIATAPPSYAQIVGVREIN